MSGWRDGAGRGYLVFVGKAAVLVVALALIWPWVAPGYGRAIATLAELGFEGRGLRVHVELDEAGNLQAEEITLGRDGRPTRVLSRVGLRGSWEGAILLLALILATPGLSRRGRLGRLAAGLGLIAGYHALYAVAYFSQALGHRVPVPLWYPFSEVWVPVLLWAALTFHAFFPRLLAADGGTGTPTAARGSRQPV